MSNWLKFSWLRTLMISEEDLILILELYLSSRKTLKPNKKDFISYLKRQHDFFGEDHVISEDHKDSREGYDTERAIELKNKWFN